jgi:uncharacterized LabA/DUF88 family protein
MSVAWFVDGAYLMKVWGGLNRTENLDYLKLRQALEARFCDANTREHIDEAYYFNADPDPPTAKQSAFHNALAYPPPGGPGLRVKLYWLHRRKLFWPARLGGEPVVHPQSGEQFELTQQKAVDVGLAFHLIRSYSKRSWRKLLLAAGDGDFHEVVQHLVENEDVSLVLIGTINSISAELRPYAAAVFELDKEAASVGRPRPMSGGGGTVS